jgi:hypothetical protein
MKVRIGQPAEHLPHWKQRLTEVPERASTFLTKPRFMVSVESVIFECFTSDPFLLRERERATLLVEGTNEEGGTGEQGFYFE